MSDGHRMVYIVTMYAVYDHGTGGVFATREEAEEHARSLAEDSDHHHDFRIDEIPFGHPIMTEPRTYHGRKCTRDVEINFVPWRAP